MTIAVDVKRFKKIQDIFKFLKYCKLPVKSEEVVSSMESYFKETGDLTPRQEQYLYDLYEKAS